MMHHTLMPPLPLMAVRAGTDPDWGHGTAVYSPIAAPSMADGDDPAAEREALRALAAARTSTGCDTPPAAAPVEAGHDAMFRYQTTRRFDGNAYDAGDIDGTLIVVGVSPSPSGGETRLDDWLVPYAAAARAAGMRQLLAVCLYAARVVDRAALDHTMHGPLNGYVCCADHLAGLGRVAAVAFNPAGFQSCRGCGGRGPLVDELDAAGVALVQLDGRALVRLDPDQLPARPVRSVGRARNLRGA